MAIREFNTVLIYFRQGFVLGNPVRQFALCDCSAFPLYTFNTVNAIVRC